VQKALGHRNIVTTTRYAHVLDSDVARPWSASRHNAKTSGTVEGGVMGGSINGALTLLR
jgi:hypothetical protein